MKKVEIKDVKPYDAAGHFAMTAMRLSGKEETGAQKFWVGLSHFLPGGGAEMAASPTEKFYYVLKGEITIVTPETEITLKKSDSIFIGPGEQRAIMNKTNMPASTLVVINYP
ncbi:MAG TPA: cupin domain-containing protein [Syntrophorhabdales bacterium]|nr:cupin domain-containing protein [Syntrophorhabdales bacterium]